MIRIPSRNGLALRWPALPVCALLLLLGLASCEKPTEIGSELGGDPLSTAFVDTFTIQMTTVLKSDEQVSSFTNTLLAGSYRDDEGFGDVSAEAYFQIQLSSEFSTFGSNPVCDSIVLQLPYNGNYIGDLSETQTLEVYRLQTEIDPDSLYRTTDVIMTDAVPLGSLGPFTPTPTTTSAVIRIPLSTTFGDEVITEANQSNVDFASAMRGLSIKPQAAGQGSILGFQVANTLTRVFLYYHNDASTGNVFELLIPLGINKFNRIFSDRSGTPIASLLMDGDNIGTAPTGEFGFVQGGVGIQTLVQIPGLDSLSKLLGDNGILHKADLVVYTDLSTTTDPDQGTPPVLLWLALHDGSFGFIKDDDDNPQYVQRDFASQLNNTFSHQVGFDADAGSYTFTITGYLQSILTGDRPNNGVFIGSVFNAARTERVLLYDQTAAADPTKAVTLRVYYTRLEE